MKVLTIAVPCYNSEAWLERCVDSLLSGGEDVEILLVDDGSTDRTAEIADRFETEHPFVIRSLHKRNGGHGSAINTGLRAASGLFFKVVDSDDRLDKKAFQKVLAFLRQKISGDDIPDMVVTNYVYDKAGARHKFIMKPRGLKADENLQWGDIRSIKKYHFMLMHSLIFRTELLRECDLYLPEHTFYVDNIYAFAPLPYVKTFCYLDENLYWYYIGRADQSVNEKNLVRQIEQYIRVVKIMANQYHKACCEAAHKECLDYMLNYLEMVLAIVCNYLNLGNTKEHAKMKQDLWTYLTETDCRMSRKLKNRLSVIVTNLPGVIGRGIGITTFRIFSKILGLN